MKEKQGGASHMGAKWLQGALLTVNVENSRAIRMAVMSNELAKMTNQLFEMKGEKQKLLAILYKPGNRNNQ